MSPHAPWLSAVPEAIDTPAMISHEEAQYYMYLGSFYEGRGRVVEAWAMTRGVYAAYCVELGKQSEVCR